MQNATQKTPKQTTDYRVTLSIAATTRASAALLNWKQADVRSQNAMFAAQVAALVSILYRCDWQTPQAADEATYKIELTAALENAGFARDTGEKFARDVIGVAVKSLSHHGANANLATARGERNLPEVERLITAFLAEMGISAAAHLTLWRRKSSSTPLTAEERQNGIAARNGTAKKESKTVDLSRRLADATAAQAAQAAVIERLSRPIETSEEALAAIQAAIPVLDHDDLQRALTALNEAFSEMELAIQREHDEALHRALTTVTDDDDDVAAATLAALQAA